jgi:hypothetical protein
MSKFLDVLRAVILPLGWVCAFLALATPVWFAAAAFGTKWEFWSLDHGLVWMTRSVGRTLLVSCVAAGLAGAALMLLHRILAGRAYGVVTSPLLALAVGIAGLGWAWHVAQARAAVPVLLDISTDLEDPPHFTTALVARRSVDDLPLDYAGKRAGDGRPLADIQAEIYPGLVTARVDRPPETVFADAMDYAHRERWRVGTASRSAGMFEAGAESFWFGLRDDIVVRIRDDGNGGSLVDIRSLARRPVHDLGRNAQRVGDFLSAMQDEQDRPG